MNTAPLFNVKPLFSEYFAQKFNLIHHANMEALHSELSPNGGLFLGVYESSVFDIKAGRNMKKSAIDS